MKRKNSQRGYSVTTSTQNSMSEFASPSCPGLGEVGGTSTSSSPSRSPVRVPLERAVACVRKSGVVWMRSPCPRSPPAGGVGGGGQQTPKGACRSKGQRSGLSMPKEALRASALSSRDKCQAHNPLPLPELQFLMGPGSWSWPPLS